MNEFEGKTIVITGAASGIGFASSVLFANAGCKVVMADIENDALQEASRAVGKTGASVLAVVTDVANADSVNALADAAYTEFGQVDILFNNAGVFASGASWECSVADYQWLFNVNVMGVAHGIQAFVPRMIENGNKGHVVITASMAGLTTMPFSSVYCSSKAAVVSLAECLYKELQATAPQIGVSVLCPELINTGISKSGRNRPSSLSNSGDVTKTEASELTDQALSEGTASGLDPSAMAERVKRGIEENKFYLLAEDYWKDIAMVRQDEIRAETNPSFVFETS